MDFESVQYSTYGALEKSPALLKLASGSYPAFIYALSEFAEYQEILDVSKFPLVC